MLTKTFTISNITDLLLPITEFRKNMSSIIENLIAPKILMKNDQPKAVIIPYDQYVSMEQALEESLDEKLIAMAEDRLSRDTFVDSKAFFNNLLEDESV